jgi:subtilisin-like proprotein convertase family protein
MVGSLKPLGQFALCVSVALLALGGTAAPAAALDSTFSNPGAIAIPDLGDATPYPSSIAVSGLQGTVEKATVTLHQFSHTCPHDVSVLLVAPNGADSILFAGLGPGMACPDSTNAELTFDQASTTNVPYPPVTGTYRPTEGDPPAPFDPPAPTGPYPLSLSNFVGIAPDGTWRLFAHDEASGDSGSIAGGWSLTLTAPPSNQFTFGTLKRNKKKGTATLTVNVPRPGILALSGGGLVPQRSARTSARRRAGKVVGAAGAVKLTIRSKGKKKRKLNRTGTVRVKPKVTYTPTGGTPNAQNRTVKLVKTLGP